MIGADAVLGRDRRATATASRSASSTTASTRRTRSSPRPGCTYPPGFPKGGTKWTTPKVIVARAFPGPGSGRAGRLAARPAGLVPRHARRRGSPPATRARPRRPGRDHPPVTGLSGVAPHAWLGNYRVFNVPTPVGHVANTPEIVAAFEAAVARRHGRDQLLRRRPADRPGERRDDRDGRERRRRRRRARSSRPATTATTSASARAGSPGHRARRDLGRRRLEHPRLRARAHRRAPRRAGDARSAIPFQPAPARDAPRPWRRATRRSSTSARSPARDGQPGRPAPLRAGRAIRTARRRTLPGRLAAAARSRSSRAATARSSRRRGAHAQAGAIGHRARRQPRRRGERDPGPARRPGRDDLRPRRRRGCARYLATPAAAARDPRRPRVRGDPDRAAAASSRASRPPARPRSATS